MEPDSGVLLGNLKPVSGSRHNAKKLGRGPGSGKGGTSGKGHKGQNSRSGGKRPAWFEGGQMPLQMRLPKRGFTNIFRVEYQIVNVQDLESFDGEVTPELLVEKGMAKKGAAIKILGNGKVSKALTVHATKFSKTALTKINEAGGKAVEIK